MANIHRGEGRSQERAVRRLEFSWLLPVLLLAVAVLGIFLPLERAQTFASLLQIVVWPVAFLVGMLYFRPEIRRASSRVIEFDAFGLKAKLQSELDLSANEAKQAPSRAQSPTQEQIERASEVKQIVGDNVDLVRSQINVLAAEYEAARALTPPGNSRTQKMEVVVAKMRTIGLVAHPFRYELSSSPSPGRRLQAVACLQVQPDYDMVEWLADRLGVEKPFIEYHALVALNAAADGLGAAAHYLSLEDALRRVRASSEHLRDDSDRMSMLREFERRVQALPRKGSHQEE